jgi:hypothetical protein
VPKKESEHIKPALEALKTGNYGVAISLLQLASTDTPADTSDDPEAIRLSKEDLKITRMRTLWLMMIAQRLVGRFDEADKTRSLVGLYFDDPTISELLSDELREILMAQADENHDEPTRQMLSH